MSKLASKPTIIFDTNALISALMYPESVSAQALIVGVGHFQLAASDSTWAELEAVSSRKKFTKYWAAQDRLLFLAQLAAMTNFYDVITAVTDCVDAADNKFLELAIDAKARVIVSGDQHLRSMHPFQGISIISPSVFLSIINT
jgi:putative PIN family toxin of toxin-antitoxin system